MVGGSVAVGVGENVGVAVGVWVGVAVGVGVTHGPRNNRSNFRIVPVSSAARSATFKVQIPSAFSPLNA